MKPQITIKVCLEIFYQDDFNKPKVVKEFSSTTHDRAYKKAQNWMSNCLAICGKDSLGRDYVKAELRVIQP